MPWNVSATSSRRSGARNAIGCSTTADSALQIAVVAPMPSASGRMAVGRWWLVVGRWSLVVGRWSLVVGRWSLVVGHWSLVVGRWSLVVGRWSLVIGRWSLVIGRWSVISHHGMEHAVKAA